MVIYDPYKPSGDFGGTPWDAMGRHGTPWDAMGRRGYLDFREFCFFYVRMVSMEEGCDPIRDYYRNVRNVPVAPL